MLRSPRILVKPMSDESSLSISETRPGQSPKHISALWFVCLLVLAICIVSALPVMVISLQQTAHLGDHLLSQVAEQQFNLMYVSIQAALDEGDYYMDFIEGWLRHVPLPLSYVVLEPYIKSMTLAWLASVSERIGGVCCRFVTEMNPNGGWQSCAAWIMYKGVRELHWDCMPNGTMMYEYRVDDHWNLLEVVGSWNAYKAKPQDIWPDGQMKWDDPSVWTEGGSVITQIGQHRMMKIGTVAILNRFWMVDSDWASLLRANLNASISVDTHEPPIAFLFDTSGRLITATCGVTNREGKLIFVNESDCEVLQQTYHVVSRPEYITRGFAFLKENLQAGTYLIGVRRIVTKRGDMTSYFLATAYPYSAVDKPIRWTSILLIISSLASLCFTIIAASLLTNLLIAKPLRNVALDLDRCVELDTSTAMLHSRTPISELFSIVDSLCKVKGTLQAVSKFVPVDVIQQSLKQGQSIAMSMTPTEASIFFLDIENFTTLTETVEIGHLVTSVASFFERLSGIIVSHGGVIDKYIGDCIMAFWNTPRADEHHQLHACEAALECVSSISENCPDLLRLEARIGLESGAVYAGLFGSRHRMNYTVVGDVVNLASRLEGLNKTFKTRILMGPNIHSAVASMVTSRMLPPVDVKGKAAKITPHELLALETNTSFSVASLSTHT